MYKLLIVSFLALTIVTGCRQKNTAMVVPGASPAPDSVALLFLKGIVCTDSSEFGSAFSTDGRSFYFSRSENHQSDIYVTTFDGTTWQQPRKMIFNTDQYSEADPAFSPDGRLFFISNRPKDTSDQTTDYDIWTVTRDEQNEWSSPENLVILNSDSNEYYISFSKEGNVYFASSRQGGFGEEDIYTSAPAEGKYGVPENLGSVVNTSASEYDPFISPTKNFIVFASSGRADSFGKADLYRSDVGNSGQWLGPVNLGSSVNSAGREYCPYFLKNSDYFFFSSSGDIKWIRLESGVL